MFHLKRWSDKQRKSNMIARKKAELADDERARKERNIRKPSYSAAHKPYERTAYGNLAESIRERKYEGDNESRCSAGLSEL